MNSSLQLRELSILFDIFADSEDKERERGREMEREREKSHGRAGIELDFFYY